MGPDAHPSHLRRVPDTGDIVEIDDELGDIMGALWSNGIRTEYSCQGDRDQPGRDPYIMFPTMGQFQAAARLLGMDISQMRNEADTLTGWAVAPDGETPEERQVRKEKAAPRMAQLEGTTRFEDFASTVLTRDGKVWQPMGGSTVLRMSAADLDYLRYNATQVLLHRPPVPFFPQVAGEPGRRRSAVRLRRGKVAGRGRVRQPATRAG